MSQDPRVPQRPQGSSRPSGGGAWRPDEHLRPLPPGYEPVHHEPAEPGAGRRTRAAPRTRPGASPSGLPAPKPVRRTPVRPRKPATAPEISVRRTSTATAATTASTGSAATTASTRTSMARPATGSSPASVTRATTSRSAAGPATVPVGPAGPAGTMTAAGEAAAPGAGSAGSRRWSRCWSSWSRWRWAASTSTAST